MTTSLPPEASKLTKLTVNLIPRSVDALETSSEQNGDSRTDTVNRSLQIYGYLTKMRAEGWDIQLSRPASGIAARWLGARETVNLWWERNEMEIPE